MHVSTEKTRKTPPAPIKKGENRHTATHRPCRKKVSKEPLSIPRQDIKHPFSEKNEQKRKYF
jgi:hypothetical protein